MKNIPFNVHANVKCMSALYGNESVLHRYFLCNKLRRKGNSSKKTRTDKHMKK